MLFYISCSYCTQKNTNASIELIVHEEISLWCEVCGSEDLKEKRGPVILIPAL